MNENAETGQRTAGESRTTWRSLTFQLLAIVVFPLIALLLILILGSTTLHENAMRQLVGDRDERAARMASTAINDQLQQRANAIHTLAGQVSGISLERGSAALSNAAYLQSNFDAGMAILRNDGQVITFDRNPSLWQAGSTIFSEGLAALQKDSKLGVYTSKVTLLSSQPQAFMFVMAQTADRQSVTIGAFYTEGLVEHVFANTLTQNQETSSAVLSSGGNVLFRKGFDSQAEKINQHAGVAEGLAGKYGTMYIRVDGNEHVVAYSPVTPLGWALLIEEPWAQVESPLLQFTLMAPLVMAPVLLLALLAVFFGIRQIVQPLQALANESSKLGWGDYGAIEKSVGGVSEIRQLQLELIHMAHKVRAAQQSLHSFIGAITSGQEEERRRLARELHDDTIQSLIAFKQRVQLVEMDWDGHPVSKALSELEQVAEQTIENLRWMVSALRPIYLEDLGLVAAIDMLAAENGKKTGSNVEFLRRGKERRLEAPIELALYRIVQEVLSNITRHAGASQVTIQMAFQAEGVRITIEDNGKGFAAPRSPAELASSGHFGLLGMFERADLIGGSIRIDSAPGQGTRLVVSVSDPTVEWHPGNRAG